jgi:hypothetical protein
VNTSMYARQPLSLRPTVLAEPARSIVPGERVVCNERRELRPAQVTMTGARMFRAWLEMDSVRSY